MKTFVQKLVIAGIFFSFFCSSSFGYEINSRYATLIYTDDKQLSEFSKKALENISCQGGSVALSDEVNCKLDVLIDKVAMILLQSQPTEELKFEILLVTSAADIQTIYMDKCGKDYGYIAFYSPKDDIIFFSVGDLRPGVLAHELAHVIIYHYFYSTISSTIQELLAQFVESHIDD